MLSFVNFSRGELKTKSSQLAYGLTRKGLEPQDVVCVFSPNSFYYHLIVIGLQCGGFTVSGANAAYTSQEMQHQLGDSGAKMVSNAKWT